MVTVRIPEWLCLEPSFNSRGRAEAFAVACQAIRKIPHYWEQRDEAPIAFRLGQNCLGVVLTSGTCLGKPNLIDWQPPGTLDLERWIQEEVFPKPISSQIHNSSIEVGWSPLNWGDSAHSIFSPPPGEVIRSAFLDAVRLALHMGHDPEGWKLASLRHQLLLTLKSNQVSTMFQPIIDLTTGKLFGVEALSRGPAGSPFESPLALFPAAEQAGCLFQLEHLCRRQAITIAAGQGLRGKLFLNINPQVVNDPAFEAGTTMRNLEILGFNPNNVVFEITERQAISDYASFCRALEHYRCQGFMVAVDDAGAGYSSLQAISELRPDFVKLDMSLVRDLNSNPVRMAICEALIGLAHRIDARVIAEGIESGEELRTLASLGARYGQGYFLGRPVRSIPKHPPQFRWFGLQLDLEALSETAAATNY